VLILAWTILEVKETMKKGKKNLSETSLVVLFASCDKRSLSKKNHKVKFLFHVVLFNFGGALCGMGLGAPF